MSSGSRDGIKEPKRPHNLKNVIYLFSSKESSLKSFPCAQLSTTLWSHMEVWLSLVLEVERWASPPPPVRLTTMKKASDIHWQAGSMGPKTIQALRKEK
jgi:hypothetical protein